jgi:hypothetical protein
VSRIAAEYFRAFSAAGIAFGFEHAQVQFGGAIRRSRQIFFARKSSISRWRGTVEVVFSLGL